MVFSVFLDPIIVSCLRPPFTKTGTLQHISKTSFINIQNFFHQFSLYSDSTHYIIFCRKEKLGRKSCWDTVAVVQFFWLFSKTVGWHLMDSSHININLYWIFCFYTPEEGNRMYQPPNRIGDCQTMLRPATSSPLHSGPVNNIQCPLPNRIVVFGLAIYGTICHWTKCQFPKK